MGSVEVKKMNQREESEEGRSGKRLKRWGCGPADADLLRGSELGDPYGRGGEPVAGWRSAEASRRPPNHG